MLMINQSNESAGNKQTRPIGIGASRKSRWLAIYL